MTSFVTLRRRSRRELKHFAHLNLHSTRSVEDSEADIATLLCFAYLISGDETYFVDIHRQVSVALGGPFSLRRFASARAHGAVVREVMDRLRTIPHVIVHTFVLRLLVCTAPQLRACRLTAVRPTG